MVLEKRIFWSRSSVHEYGNCAAVELQKLSGFLFISRLSPTIYSSRFAAHAASYGSVRPPAYPHPTCQRER